MSTSKEVSDFVTMMLLMQQKKRDAANDVINNAYRTMQMKQTQQQIDTQALHEKTIKASHDNAASGASGGSSNTAVPPDNIKNIIDANVPENMRPYAYQMAQKESGFNPNNVSPTGATGLFQFISGTGKQYGLVGNAGDIRKDPVANTKAFVQLTQDNAAALTKSLGRPPTWAELAVAHQQGADGAVSLLTGKGTINRSNLADNNVPAGASPSAAVAHIQQYYGVPNTPWNAPPAPSQAPAPGATPTPAPTAGTPQTIPTQAQLSTPTPENPDGNWRGYTTPTLDNLTPAEKAKVDALKVEYKKTGDYSDPLSRIDMDRDAAAKAARAQAPQDNPTPPAQVQQPSAPYDPKQGGPAPAAALSPVEQPDPPVDADQASAIPDPSILEDVQSAARGGMIQHFANGGSVKSFADGGSTDEDDGTPDEPDTPDAPTAPAATPQASPVAPAPPAPVAPAPTHGIVDPSQPSAQTFQANAAPQGEYHQPVTPRGNDTSEDNPLSGLFSAVSKGIRSLESEHGLTSAALPGSPQEAQGRQNFRDGKGAASPEQLTAVKKIIDPTGQLNENLANCAALEASSNFWLERGEPEKAAKAAGAMMVLLRNTSAKYGETAVQELNAGHRLAGLQAITKAYDQVPDAHSIQLSDDGEGGANVVHRGPNGQVVWQGKATPAQLLGVALGLKNGTEYWKQLIQNAGSKDPEYEKPDTQEEKDTEAGSDAQTRLGVPEPGQAATHISTTMTPEEYAGKSSAFRGGADAAYQTQKGIAADRAAPSIAAAKAAAAVKGETQKQALENEKAADAQFGTALDSFTPAGGKAPDLAAADKADIIGAAQHIMSTPGIGATEANRIALATRLGTAEFIKPDPKDPKSMAAVRVKDPITGVWKAPVKLNSPAISALQNIFNTKAQRDTVAAAEAKARQGNIDRITNGASDVAGALGRGLSNVVGAVRSGIPERASKDPLSYDPTF